MVKCTIDKNIILKYYIIIRLGRLDLDILE